MKAYATFVALDDSGKPKAVPPVVLLTDEDRRRAEHAAQRRAARLATRPSLE